MYECRHHAEDLQFFRIKSGVGGIHRQQGNPGFKLQAFNGEFAICFCDDDIPLHRSFGLVDNHQVAGVQAHIFHRVANGADKVGRAGATDTLVQGYAGVGKTTQFRAVMSAIGTLPEREQPLVIGVAPTHRAVSEMRDAGVPETQTLAAFIHDTQQQLRGGERPDFSNVLFLVDESSMVGNADMAKAYSLIAGGGGRAVSSGDTDQLQSIAPGQPFRLLQKRSAIDVAVMQEIVRQTPALKPAVYSLINRDIGSALTTIESVVPAQVPRRADAWQPDSSVMEFSREREEAVAKAVAAGDLFIDGQPATLLEAIVKDYTGRTPEAQAQTIVITALNADRRQVNAMIHDARQDAGEVGEKEVTLPVLTPANIRDGELRRMTTWEASRDSLVLLDST